MSLGAGHVWRTVSLADAADFFAGETSLCSLVCVHCGASRGAATARVRRFHRPDQKHGKNFSRTSFRFFYGRPLGTCPKRGDRILWHSVPA